MQALGITPERRRRWCAPVAPAFLEAVNRAKTRLLRKAGTALVQAQRQYWLRLAGVRGDTL